MANIRVKTVASNTNISVQDGNNIIAAISEASNINLQVTPLAPQIVQINRGVQGEPGVSGGQRVLNITTTPTLAPNITLYDQINITALATSLFITNPTGFPLDAQKLIIRILDDGTSQLLTYSNSAGGYRAVGVVLPAATRAGLDLYLGCIYNSQVDLWDVIALVQQG